MFIRQKKNKSGVVSVQIIDKSSGRYKLFKTIGSSNNPDEIDFLIKKANEFLKQNNIEGKVLEIYVDYLMVS